MQRIARQTRRTKVREIVPLGRRGMAVRHLDVPPTATLGDDGVRWELIGVRPGREVHPPVAQNAQLANLIVQKLRRLEPSHMLIGNVVAVIIVEFALKAPSSVSTMPFLQSYNYAYY